VPASSPGSGEVFSPPRLFDEPIWINHLLLAGEMRVLVPSLVLSIFAVCVIGAKVGILHWDKQILTWRL
jgi:hypothetical protein